MTVLPGMPSTFFETNNRGVKSVTLNLKAPEGRAILHRLVARADIFGQNYRPGAAEKNDFGYEELRRINPKLVYVSISGYGSRGPRPLHEFLARRCFEIHLYAVNDSNLFAPLIERRGGSLAVHFADDGFPELGQPGLEIAGAQTADGRRAARVRVGHLHERRDGQSDPVDSPGRGVGNGLNWVGP
jgi:hypothetical protein